jgi:hypothetical protein
LPDGLDLTTAADVTPSILRAQDPLSFDLKILAGYRPSACLTAIYVLELLRARDCSMFRKNIFLGWSDAQIVASSFDASTGSYVLSPFREQPHKLESVSFRC